METRANYLLVATFVVAVVCSVWAALWLLELRPPSGLTAYDILFKGSVAGLKVDAPVSLSGISVGTVESIEVDRNDSTQVRVKINVAPDAAIKTDSIAKLQINILTGIAQIDISGGSGSAKRLTASAGRPLPVIQSEPSEVQSFLDWAEEAVPRIKRIEDALIVALNDQNIRKISDSLQTVDRATASGVQETNATLDGIRTALARIRGYTSEASDGLDGSKSAVVQVENRIGEAHIFLEDVQGKAKAVDAVTQELRPEARDLARNRLPQIEVFIQEARSFINIHLIPIIDNLTRNTNGVFGR